MMAKLLLTACIFTTLTVAALGWELEPDHLALANPPKDQSNECDDLVLDLIDCISFLSGDKNATKPTQDCCKGLKTVLDTNATCVCVALESAPSMGVIVDMSRAAAMASLCHINNAPPISKCNSSAAPSPSPVTPSPSPSTPAPAPAKPNLPPSPAPVSPSPPPPSAAPTPATPPSSPATPPSSPVTPPSSPVSPSPSSSSPTPPVTPSPSAEAPETGPPSTSGAMHIEMPFLVSFAVIVVSLFYV